MSRTPSALERELVATIRSTGPIPLHRYMEIALQHPEHGYYRRGDPLGGAGDFTTSPEISQIFGELIGLWLVDRWEAASRPDPAILVELGPGRGTLMADALRAAALAPDFLKAARLHLVESSATLRAMQARKLDAVWHERLADVPQGPTLLVANEFFDALPIHQFVREADGWSERHVGLDDTGGLALLSGPAGPETALIPNVLEDVPTGAVVELCPTGLAIVSDIARRIAGHGGAALIVDYGYARSAPGESLQAVRRHQPVGILDRPGESDLTAHVNFEHLRTVARARGADTAGPVGQGAFLAALGIRLRAAMLERRAMPAQRKDIRAAVRRLVEPDMMGELFKVMAVVPKGTGDPAIGGIGNG